VDGAGNLLLSSICEQLIKIGYPVTNSLVSYFSPEDDLYTYVGKEPLSQEESLSTGSLTEGRLYMKFRFSEQLTEKVSQLPASLPCT
jgi:hypothetical protein